MRKVFLLLAAIFAIGVIFNCSSLSFAATDGVYTISEISPAWDGTDANRLKAPTADYNHTYGDEESLTYTLPWAFTFYGAPYNQINADTNGNIWFTTTGPAYSIDLANTGRGPVIAAWNEDLSSNYYGGVFVQHKSNPERVVVEWQTETYTDEGENILNDFEVVLFPYGKIQADYNSIAASNVNVTSSGISKDDGTHFLNLTSNISPSPKSFAFVTNLLSLNITATAPSPQSVGAQVTFTAAVTGGSGSYEYQFWLYNGATWTKVRDYLTSPGWTWNTTGQSAGIYTIEVWARKAGSSAGYESVNSLSYTLNPPVSSVNMVISPSSPATCGTPITFSATASGGTGSYLYYFTWRNPATGIWSVGQAYSSSSIWTWNTMGLAAGTYTVQVWAKNAGSIASYEAYKSISYTLSPPPARRMPANIYYPTLAAAYSAASDGDTIQLRNITLLEGATITKSITLDGGYDSTFANKIGLTTLKGNQVNINSGVTTMKDIIIDK